ncbi:peroxidase-like [Neocloeon triangulifer]|uniref:peroxidase-like n=1 Tax=Neocloeon triangulifer TaxID=2078957 RepID=UPI00286F69D8|nr:peroxidase-like [Neocloeon triangulifer]
MGLRLLLLLLWLAGPAHPFTLPPFLSRLFNYSPAVEVEGRSDLNPTPKLTPEEPEWVPLAPLAPSAITEIIPPDRTTPSEATTLAPTWLPVKCLPANDTQGRLPTRLDPIEAEEDPAETEWQLVPLPDVQVVHRIPWDSQVSPKFAQHRPSFHSQNLYPPKEWLSRPDEVRPEPEPEPEPEPFPEPEPAAEPEPVSALGSTVVVKAASEFGVEQMLQLFNVTEPQLYKEGLFLPKRSPGALVASFNWQPGKALPLARYAHATLLASEHLKESLFRLTGNNRASPSNSLLRECPLRKGDFPCSRTPQRYRSADGRCNNPRFSNRGAPFTPYRRLLPPSYNDGIQEVRRSVTGAELPSARTISVAVLRDPQDKKVADADSKASHLLMQWGQFLDHDMIATPQSHGFNGSVPLCCRADNSGELQPNQRHPECYPIPVDPSDQHYSKRGVRCLHFVRSAPAPRDDCGFGARQQANAVTAFLDGSTIYGSSEERQLELRLFHQGQLNTMPGKKSKPLLPPAPPDEQVVCRASKRHPCLKAGDLRVNEQPGLTSLHILFLREHNRVAKALSGLNPTWSDEQLFQEARRIVIAEIQHITLREFLPVVLGPDVYKVFEFNGTHTGYDETVDPTIPNSFAAAAYRFGHSLVQDKFWRCNALHQRLQHNKTLHQELAQPGIVMAANTPERILIGMSRQLARNSYHTMSRELTDHLFETPEFNPGLDLAAMNIQRGRDHGLMPYNSWREPCGLRRVEKWEDLTYVMSSKHAALLPQLYNHVDDIDLFVGGMGEKPVPGGLVGPTFACIIGQTFADLRVGDRMWYEAENEMSSFSPKQLNELKKANLARIMCDNLEGLLTITRFPMKAHNSHNNSYVQCVNKKKIKEIGLAQWQELVPGDPDAVVIEDVKIKRTTPKPGQRPGFAQMLLNRLRPRPTRPRNKLKEGDANLLEGIQVQTYFLRSLNFVKDEPWPTVEIPKPNFR